MKDNFFVPSFGNKPRNLAGREDVLKAFGECMEAVPGSRERAMLMLGQRGMGKTVLLLQLADMAREKGFVVASPTVVSKDMSERIVEKLYVDGERFLKSRKGKVTGGSISILGFGAGIQLGDGAVQQKSIVRRLSECCEAFNKSGHPVLILIDEVQADNEALKQLIVAYQEMVGEGRDVAIVMAGLPQAISSVLNDHVLTFLNRAVKIDLKPLRLNEIEMYYIRAFSELGIKISEKVIGDLAAKAEGSPYMMQLLGHYITIAADESGKVSDKDIRASLKRAKEDFQNDICMTTLAMLSDRDNDFLKVMAKDNKDSDVGEIAKRMGVSNQYVQTYKRRLIQAGVLDQPRRGRVQIIVPYLKEYLEALD